MSENFLEKLVAQWYDYQGYMTKRNLYFGTGGSGGKASDIDVLAFDPFKNKAVHIEAATLGDSYEETGKKHKKKFEKAKNYYKDYVPVDPNSVEPKSLILSSSDPKQQSISDFEQNSPSEFIHISTFLEQILNELKGVETSKNITSERLSLIRLCHIITEYFDLSLKEKYQ